MLSGSDNLIITDSSFVAHTATVTLFTSGLYRDCLFLKPSLKLATHITVSDLINSIKFTDHFANSSRFAVLFGSHSYTYGKTRHCPVKLSCNNIVQSLYNKVQKTFPEVTFNSVLINYYPDPHSKINLHADDETDIVDNSLILTLSLGGIRRLTFAHKYTHQHICSLNTEHGDFLLFSKNSQLKFVHGIIDDFFNYIPEPRVSLTFRMLCNS